MTFEPCLDGGLLNGNGTISMRCTDVLPKSAQAAKILRKVHPVLDEQGQEEAPLPLVEPLLAYHDPAARPNGAEHVLLERKLARLEYHPRVPWQLAGYHPPLVWMVALQECHHAANSLRDRFLGEAEDTLLLGVGERLERRRRWRPRLLPGIAWTAGSLALPQ